MDRHKLAQAMVANLKHAREHAEEIDRAALIKSLEVTPSRFISEEPTPAPTLPKKPGK